MSETVSSVILTSALFLTMFILLASFLIIVNVVTNDYVKVRFGDLANYIKRNLADITMLCYESSQDDLAIGMILQIPTEVNNQGYSINIIVENNTFEVLVISDMNNFLYGKAPLWATSETEIQFNGSVVIPTLGTVNCRSKVYSGFGKIVVWAIKQNGKVIAGIGTL